jgi:hypothetical protein
MNECEKLAKNVCEELAMNECEEKLAYQMEALLSNNNVNSTVVVAILSATLQSIVAKAFTDDDHVAATQLIAKSFLQADARQQQH